jgi:hypothetical protein
MSMFQFPTNRNIRLPWFIIFLYLIFNYFKPIVYLFIISYAWKYDSAVFFLVISCQCESRSWLGVLDTTLCDKVCQWPMAGRLFSSGSPVSSTNKSDLHDIAEILLGHWQTLSHNVVSSTPRHERDSNSEREVVIDTNCIGSCNSNYHDCPSLYFLDWP